jgi:hypothetical protein
LALKPKAPFDKCVFINCPFDKDYEPILQAIIFCVIYAGFVPRIALESNNSAETRITKILEIINSSKFSIHDISRCQAKSEGEYYRLNMPFELGIDYGSRAFGRKLRDKRILILEEQRFRYQAAISDLSGCDIQMHKGDFATAIRKVRNWLVSEAGVSIEGASTIFGAYSDFQEWYYERQIKLGFSDEDIQDYPTIELMDAMEEWVVLGKPI